MRPVRTLLSSLALAAALVLGGSVTALAEGPTPSPAAAQTVRPEAPEFDDEEGLFWIPEQDGVQYLVVEEDFEWVLEPGEWYWDGPVTIRARATAGYTLTGTTTWSHEFPEWVFEPEHPFIDVPRGSEHEEAIDFMYWAGLSTGWDTPRGPEYRPLSPVNRDAMAAFLYRLEGEPEVDLPRKSPFTDIRPGMQHYEAVVWAYQEGITTGWVMPDGTRQFRPTQPIARDAMAAFLYRFDGEPRYRAPSTPCFRDVPSSSLFAKEICWMRDMGISEGWADGTYRPLQSVKRDAMAAFLYRY